MMEAGVATSTPLPEERVCTKGHCSREFSIADSTKLLDIAHGLGHTVRKTAHGIDELAKVMRELIVLFVCKNWVNPRMLN